MRIITGTAKGETLEGELTRPTGESTKEAIFSAIQCEIEGMAVLDLFAGSGQMGLEALSRGAVSAMFVDASPEAMAIVKSNAKKTKLFDLSRFLISDYRSYIRKAAGRDRWGLIFLDPPYASDAVGDAVRRILEADLAEDGAILVCESGKPYQPDPDLAPHLLPIKEQKYGVAYIHIFRYVKEA